MAEKASKKAKKGRKKSPTGNPVGRPIKFKSVATLQAAIDAYFASCWEPVMHYKIKEEALAREVNNDPGAQKYSKDDYEWVQETDWRGEPVFRQRKPYTISGLALALKTNRETLRDYGTKEQFSDTIKNAKLRIQEYVETQLYTPKIAAGVIFNLKNNYGWKDEHKHTHDVADTLADFLRESDGKSKP